MPADDEARQLSLASVKLLALFWCSGRSRMQKTTLKELTVLHAHLPVIPPRVEGHVRIDAHFRLEGNARRLVEVQEGRRRIVEEASQGTRRRPFRAGLKVPHAEEYRGHSYNK